MRRTEQTSITLPKGLKERALSLEINISRTATEALKEKVREAEKEAEK